MTALLVPGGILGEERLAALQLISPEAERDRAFAQGQRVTMGHR